MNETKKRNKSLDQRPLSEEGPFFPEDETGKKPWKRLTLSREQLWEMMRNPYCPKFPAEEKKK